MNWISVEDRLPKTKDTMLCFAQYKKGSKPVFAWYNKLHEAWFFYGKERKGITHWVEITNPLKSEQKPNEMTVRVEHEIQIPRVPNFIMLSGDTPKDKKVSIADLSESDLDKIAEMWRTNLHKRAQEIRDNQ